ncbi:Tex-like N-terminal domain-containing protein [Shigella flexneri]
MPFIARYRKEITGGLDDTQLRNLETRLSYLRELEERMSGDPQVHFRARQTHR